MVFTIIIIIVIITIILVKMIYRGKLKNLTVLGLSSRLQ